MRCTRAHNLVAQRRVEVHAVGLDQRAGGLEVALALDPLHLGEQPARALVERVDVGHHVERLAVAPPLLHGVGVRHQPPHDELAVAHVVFFEVRALAHAPQLHQGVAREGLVLGARDLGLVLRPRPGPARPASGAARSTAPPGRRASPRASSSTPAAPPARSWPARGSAWPDPCPITSCMLVVSSAATPLQRDRALRFLARPRELGPVRLRHGPVVRLHHVGERHRLAAVRASRTRSSFGRLIADRRHRPGVAGLDHDVDRVGGDARSRPACGSAGPRACGPRTTARGGRASGSGRSSRGSRRRPATPTRPSRRARRGRPRRSR